MFEIFAAVCKLAPSDVREQQRRGVGEGFFRVVCLYHNEANPAIKVSNYIPRHGKQTPSLSCRILHPDTRYSHTLQGRSGTRGVAVHMQVELASQTTATSCLYLPSDNASYSSSE